MRAAPITDNEFDVMMAPTAPFEAAPHIAVGVSGGADSLALAFLVHRWAVRRGGWVTALTVDHGLRPESGAEAETVARQMAQIGCAHQILSWTGEKPQSGIQAAARRARFRLFEQWCRENGVLHVALAHHAGDQAETFLMRAARGGRADGLAAMSPVRWLGACRVIRPLLDVPKERLLATAKQAGLAFIDDPSNADVRFERVRIRNLLADGGLEPEAFARSARYFAEVRGVLEAEAARWIATHLRLAPAGFAAFDRTALADAARDTVERAVGRLAAMLGGRDRVPPAAKVAQLVAALGDGRAATLGGCRFVPEGGTVGVYREARNLPPPAVLAQGAMHFDGRFRVVLDAGAAPVVVRAWDPDDLQAWTRKDRPAWFQRIPVEARAGMLVLQRERSNIVAHPGLPGMEGVSVRFRPMLPLAGSGFSVA